MANHNLPSLSSSYQNFVQELDARLDDVSVMFDPALIVGGVYPALTTVSNIITGTVRWSSASLKWQKWSGTAWVDLATNNTYSIAISGNANTVTNGVYTNGSYADPTWITSIAGTKITGNIGGQAATVANGFYTTSSIFLGTTSVTANRTSGALTLNDVSISGNAGTVTNGVYTNSSFYLGTTQISASRASGELSLAGVSIDGNAGTVTNGVYTNSSFYLGTTQISASRTSGALTLAGVSIDGSAGSAGSVTNGVYTTGNQTIAGNKTFSGKVLIANGSATAPSLAFNGDTTTDTGFYWTADGYTNFTNNGVYSGSMGPGGAFLAVGNITAYGSATQPSDIRLKTNIVKIDGALDKVCQLNGITYDRIDKPESGRQTGVIAQEVQKVLPEAIFVLDDENKTLTVAYGNLVGLLIESIKELKSELDAIKTKLS